MQIEHVKLGSVATLNPRWRDEDLTPASRVAYVTLGALSVESARVKPEMRDQIDIRAPHHCFQSGDLLVANQLTSLKTGKVAQVEIVYEYGFCSKNLLVIRPDPERLDARFLMHFLRQTQMPTMVEAYLGNAVGRHPPALDFLRHVQLPLPSLTKQRRWAEALDAGMESCIGRRREIDTLEKMRLALFSDMFGDPKTLTARLPTDALVHHLDALIFGSARWLRYAADTGEPLIRRCNLGENRMVNDDLVYLNMPPLFASHRTRVMAGDVLISTAANLGRSALAPDDIGAAYINQGVAILRSRSVEPAFLAAYLCSAAGIAEIERVQHAGPKPTLNRAAICALRLPVPSRALQCQLQQANQECEQALIAAQTRLVQEQSRFVAVERAAFKPQRAGAPVLAGDSIMQQMDV
jgi:type I restriction enzyme S subunit